MTLLRKFRGLFQKRKLDLEMAEEMRAHLELQAAENEARGMEAREARYAAQRAFGGMEQIKERVRDERRHGFGWLEHMLRDVRYGLRQLARAPAFTIATVLILGLGIGANTAIFTVVNTLMLRVLPVREPGRLVVLEAGYGNSYALFDLFRAEVKSLEGIFAIGHIEERRMLARDFGVDDTESIRVQEVSGDFFSVLGRSARLGRALSAADDHDGAARPVIVLSHAYWRKRFNEDPAVIGKTVVVNELPVTIVGVMPADFFGVDAGTARVVQAWCPLWLKTQLDDGFEAERLTRNAAGSTWLSVMGRLREGITMEQARSELAAIERHGLEAQGRHPSQRPFRLEPGERGVTRLRGSFQRPIVVLWAIAGIVLAIVCANVGGLILARGAARQREFAVRLAMGASRWRLVRQLVTESLLLGALGSALGMVFALWGASSLARLTLGGDLDLTVDFKVVSFAALAALGTGIACGLLPALRFSGLDLTTAVKGDAGQVVQAGPQRANHVLVVLQLALSFVLLAAAELFVRTLVNLRQHDYGVAREHVIQFALNTSRARMDAAKAELHREVLAALEGLVGVDSATISQGGLFGRVNTGSNFTIRGEPGEAEVKHSAGYYSVARRYFETRGIRLIAGRDFDIRDDQPNAPRVVVISESIARELFGGANPLGRTLLLSRDTPVEIVGVARDVDHGRPRAGRATQHAIYLPYFQHPTSWNLRIEFVVRTAMEPHALAPSLRALVRRIDRGADVIDLGTPADLLDGVFHNERAIAQLAGFFGSLALALSGIGLYGLLAYNVQRRTREIGVRMALGAEAWAVVRLVLKHSLGLVIAGCVAGVGMALGLGRLIERQLYGVNANDPLALTVAAALLLVIALLACWLPARRATKIDPMTALRAE